MNLEQLRAAIRAALDERAAAQAAVDKITEAPQAENRALTADETSAFNEARGKLAPIDERLAGLDEAKRNAEQDVEARAAAARIAAELGAAPVAGVGGAVVRNEARTYNPQNDRNGRNFLRDIGLRHMDPLGDAAHRLQRHMQEERTERAAALEGFEGRAAGTAAFAGLVVPQYLTDLVAKNAAAGRPLANICNHHDLPEAGMTVNISRITTATSAAAQTENAAASETNIDDTILTETVFTVASQQTLSRQAVERGTGTEDITVDDMIRRYHTALDSKLINDATTGLTNVAQNVAYTDATPTALELYPKILNAQSNLETVMLDQGVGNLYAVMHSRRWAWMQSQVGTSWPLISQPGYGVQAGGANFSKGYGQGDVRGVLPAGIGVITDNSISTALGAGTEDEIYVVNASELHLWEDPNAPLYIRTDATAAASLGILYVIYGYAAYSFRRYTNGHQKISGTGLIAPTF
jgi:hypothetical protein